MTRSLNITLKMRNKVKSSKDHHVILIHKAKVWKRKVIWFVFPGSWLEHETSREFLDHSREHVRVTVTDRSHTGHTPKSQNNWGIFGVWNCKCRTGFGSSMPINQLETEIVEGKDEELSFQGRQALAKITKMRSWREWWNHPGIWLVKKTENVGSILLILEMVVVTEFTLIGSQITLKIMGMKLFHMEM